jgi:hypothetical protein
MGFWANSRLPNPDEIASGTQVVMCDKGPSGVLRTRSAFCTSAALCSLSAAATSTGARMRSTDNTLTLVRIPIVTRFSNKPVKRACCPVAMVEACIWTS